MLTSSTDSAYQDDTTENVNGSVEVGIQALGIAFSLTKAGEHAGDNLAPAYRANVVAIAATEKEAHCHEIYLAFSAPGGGFSKIQRRVDGLLSLLAWWPLLPRGPPASVNSAHILEPAPTNHTTDSSSEMKIATIRPINSAHHDVQSIAEAVAGAPINECESVADALNVIKFPATLVTATIPNSVVRDILQVSNLYQML